MDVPHFRIATKGEGQVLHRCMRLEAGERVEGYQSMKTSPSVPMGRRREIAAYAATLAKAIRGETK